MRAISMGITTVWRCEEGCNPFETVGLAQFCPHCGNKEVYPIRDTLRDYEIVDNASTPTRFDDEP